MTATADMTGRRRRGVLGWFFLILFWGFNLLMLASVVAGVGNNAQEYQALTAEAERSAYAAGTAIGIGFLVMLWAAGAVILGLFVMMTRGIRVN